MTLREVGKGRGGMKVGRYAGRLYGKGVWMGKEWRKLERDWEVRRGVIYV